VVDLCKTEVGERQVPEGFRGILGADQPCSNVRQQTAQPSFEGSGRCRARTLTWTGQMPSNLGKPPSHGATISVLWSADQRRSVSW
jgi:hypothetical protein